MTRFAAAFIVLLAPVVAMAIDVQVTIKRVDADGERITFSAPDGRERTAKVAPEAKLLDANGTELARGIKSEQLKEGVRARLTVVPEGNQPVIQALRLSGVGGDARPAAAADPLSKQDTSALVALTDMGPGDEYHGAKGGLYPGVSNMRPVAHEQAGLKLAQQIRPLDQAGKPAANGKIGLISIGFSNTVQCFEGFMDVARRDRSINPHVILANCAQGGRSAFMIKNAEDGTIGTAYWKEWVGEHLKAAELTAEQVQVVWLKETDASLGPGVLAQLGVKEYEPPLKQPFPKSAQTLQGELRLLAQILPKRFPNARLCYLSSRSYGGWALREGNREPFSYETGYAVKWLIEEQIKGESALNFDPQNGEVKAPWLSWGPYLWANGDRPRKDGFVFAYDDYRENDRMHHSAQGTQKMGTQLLNFFKSDATTKEWFLK